MNGPFDLAPADWATLRALLDTAIELDPDARTAWIETLAPRYDALKPRLRALLAQADDTAALARLNAPPRIETAQFAPVPSARAGDDTEASDRVGPYRLIRMIGEGGMGTVWLAERTDMLQRRPVALKLPRGAWRRAALAERMAREREILARLNHPNIARLYDAGIDAQGQPYLALEYVEGERIDAYCRRNALDVAARLRLFLQVTRAVAHAHANLVVHRDLKPANILVAADGTVRLLDFGIAKLLEDGTARETELTQLAGRALTPDYAAPEQIVGEPIGTAADVYALGVVLFELLTGARPYAIRRDSRAALEEAILNVDPPRPSSVATTPKLRKRLRGDLDTIVLKALKKAPAERYGTADAIADDIERHLQSRPVVARPDRAAYRMRKFVARNRLAVGAGASILVAVLAGSSVAVWQAQVARAEQQRAENVKAFIASIFRDASPWVGPQQTPSAIELLHRARARIDEASVSDAATRIELMNTLGESFLGLQSNDAAQRTADETIALSRQLLGENHPQTLRARSLRFQTLRNAGRTTEMRAEIEAILSTVLPSPDRHPEATVTALNDRAELELDEGRYAEAEATAREALALTDRLEGRWQVPRISLWKAIAGSYESRTMYREAAAAAERSYREALKAYEGRGRHPQLVNVRLVYARNLSSIGDYATAIPLMQKAVDDTGALFGADSRSVGQYLQNLSVVQARAGDLASARENAGRALDILAKHYGREAPHYGAALDAAGFVALSSRRPAEAIAAYDAALAIVVRHYGWEMEHAQTVRMRRALAQAYAGDVAAARRELDAVAESYRTRGFAGMSRPLLSLGEALRLGGDYALALDVQREALAAVRSSPTANRERMPILAELGLDLVELGRHAEALPVLVQANESFDALLLQPTPQRADAWVALGRAYLGLGDVAKAVPLLERADAFWRDFGPDTRWAAEAALWLGRAHAAAGRGEQARELLARAAAGLAASPFSSDARLVALARGG